MCQHRSYVIGCEHARREAKTWKLQIVRAALHSQHSVVVPLGVAHAMYMPRPPTGLRGNLRVVLLNIINEPLSLRQQELAGIETR